MAVLFDVSPKDVEPGHDVTLNATLINTGTNTTFTGYQPTVRFYDVSSSGAQSTHSETDNGDGKIYYTLTYPNDGHAHAYKAEVVSNLLNDTLLPQSIVSNPVQLTASKTTRFILNASREYSSTTHTIYGWLKWNETGVGNVTVKLKVNETEYLVTTDGTGYFSKTLDLKPVDDAPTPYEVLASFEDNFTQAINCTAYATTPDGQDYPACTTVQYGYKPATKSLNLEVTYESTKVTDPDSPEQMQQEAEQGGWLTIWHEFSWSYPWYRLHIDVSVNPTFCIGFNPILPGGEIAEWGGLGFFSGLSDEVVQTAAIEALGLIATYLIAKYTSIGSFATGIVMELLKIGFQVGFLAPAWNSADAMRASALMSAIMLLFVVTDFGSTVSNFIVWIIDELKWVCGGAFGALTWVLVKLKDMVLWGRGASSMVVDIMEGIADAALLVIAMRRSNQLLHGT